jgi:hypothetical protein
MDDLLRLLAAVRTIERQDELFIAAFVDALGGKFPNYLAAQHKPITREEPGKP